MAYQEEGPRYGDEVWADDDEVRTIAGEEFAPWKTWDECCGPWKFPNGLMMFLQEAGFRCPTPIQANCWPPLVKGKDVIGVAKTGSGKTLGYLLPGYIKVKRQVGDAPDACEYTRGPVMLVLAPTRELCQQIYEESERFGTPAGIKTACCYGGAPKSGQQKQLWSGPHCVVATPGRLNDFLEGGVLKLTQCSYLVLDEADRMLDMGFEPQVKTMMHYLPSWERQTALFTATWPREVRDIAAKLTTTPTHIQVGTSDAMTSNADITQHIVKISSEGDKMRHLESVIFPRLQQTNGAALIFTRTKKQADTMFKNLSRNGAPIACLHGDMEQRERDNALWNFKNGRAKVLVATDVAQRGLDIKNVQIVVNFDPPGNAEDYVHRIGRTGRAGEKGDAYTYLYDHEQGPAANIKRVMQKSGQAVPAELQEILGGGGKGGWGGGGGGGGKGGGSTNVANADGGWGNWKAGGGGGGGGGAGSSWGGGGGGGGGGWDSWGASGSGGGGGGW